MQTRLFFRLTLALLVTLGAGYGTNVFALDDIPKRLPFDRYASMINKSPFAVASVVAPPAATPSFAKDLYVANAARMPEGDLVTVQSATDRNLKEYLTTKGPNEHGYLISNIEWSDKPGQTKVTISKDGQFATLGFNQALMAQPVPVAAGQPPPPAVPQPAVPAPAYAPARPQMPAVPTPPPHLRGVIQRNPSMATPPRSDTANQ